MQLILQMVTLASIYICVGIFKYKTEHNYEFDLKSPHIRLHKGYLILGASLSIIGTLCSLLIYLDGSEGVSFVMFGIAIASSLLVFAYFSYRITFDDEKIICYRFFKRTQTIYYKDISEIRYGLDVQIKTKSQSLVIPNHMTNTIALILKITPYLPKRKKVIELPKVRRYCDSVERSWEIIIVFTIVEVLLFGIVLTLLVLDFPNSLKDLGFWLTCGVWGAFSAFVFLCIYSAKRAHSSVFWKKIARHLYKEGYLKD